MIPEILFLVEQICPRTTQIYNLGAAISVLLQTGAFEAVEGIGDSLKDRVSDVAERRRCRVYAYLATADKAFVLVVAEGAFVADADEGCGADVTVAYGTLAVAFVAEAADRNAGRLAAHNQITVSSLAYGLSLTTFCKGRTGDGATCWRCGSVRLIVDLESPRRDEGSRFSREVVLERVMWRVSWMFVVCGSCRSFSMRKARVREQPGDNGFCQKFAHRNTDVINQLHLHPPATKHREYQSTSCRNHGRDGKQFSAVQQHLGLFTFGPAAPAGPSHHLRLHNAPLYAQPARSNCWCNHRSAEWTHNHHGAGLPVQD
jgi:hypothetical protein